MLNGGSLAFTRHSIEILDRLFLAEISSPKSNEIQIFECPLPIKLPAEFSQNKRLLL
ncbi:hypothetical protein METHB2_850002 [Candidatus Methylobacter favarea]|uniref:Uncharacterized protein n=1 Tax=Candidatus Methylobacter favarea TaxID=2707345 RepID=A0A8S0XVS3_9GAMM|nr:hypothetical protein METHB2_850002 [Candidatus Methylobacter favarea]